MSDAEYTSYYEALKPLMEATDLSRASIDAILEDVVGERIADIGCGRGYLVKRIAGHRPAAECVGVDIASPQIEGAPDNVTFAEGWLGRLPFPDKAFDTVICTHTLEHVPDLDSALSDLRRIARRRLIIVVPREREYLYSFNLHVHFFPYLHTFLNRVGAPAGRHSGRLIGRDIHYVEDVAP
jgi:ubiquinone/menaquinone biosynthesis C-methylase UbiE